MAYQYEKVNHELLVPQIEDQLMMYMKQENIAIGEKLPSEYKLAELFEVRILLEPEVAAVASRNATEEEKQHIKELCDETERIYLEGKNHIPRIWNFMRP